MMKSLSILGALTALGIISAVAPASTAYAANWEVCNGAPVIWRKWLVLHRNRCSIPDSGPINRAYWNGIGVWNDLIGVVDDFRANDPSDCESNAGDGENEISLAARSEIDGNNGLTMYQSGICFIAENDIDEADVIIANDMDFSVKAGNYAGARDGRSTFVHELGHLFGLDHDDGFAAMHATQPRAVVGGVESATNWPSDTRGMNAMYGFTQNLPNMMISAQGLVDGSIQNLDPASAITMCRGTSGNVHFTIANSGNVSSGQYTFRMRLSTTAPLDGGRAQDTGVVAIFNHQIGAFVQGPLTLPLRIPNSIPYGTYYIYVDLDPSNSVREFRKNDNHTVSPIRIVVNC